jgi:hypothetical protein
MSSIGGALVGFAKFTGTILRETLAHPLKTSIIEIHERDNAWEITVRNGARQLERETTESEKAE